MEAHGLSNKTSLIQILIDSIESSAKGNSGYLLVDLPTFYNLMDLIEESKLRELLEGHGGVEPDLLSESWVNWYVEQRQKFGIKASEISRDSNINKGDLSNFEKKRRDFAPLKRRRLRGSLLKLISIKGKPEV